MHNKEEGNHKDDGEDLDDNDNVDHDIGKSNEALQPRSAESFDHDAMYMESYRPEKLNLPSEATATELDKCQCTSPNDPLVPFISKLHVVPNIDARFYRKSPGFNVMPLCPTTEENYNGGSTELVTSQLLTVTQPDNQVYQGLMGTESALDSENLVFKSGPAFPYDSNELHSL